MVNDAGNAFKGGMKNKSELGLGEQLGNKMAQGLLETPNSRMGAYGDPKNFNGASLGSYNARRERLLGKNTSRKPSLGPLETRRTYAQQHKYTFEEFIHKLFNGKIPSLQASNGEDKEEQQQQQQSDLPENKRNDLESKKGLSLIPTVLLVQSRERVESKKEPVLLKKKPAIKNKVLLEDLGLVQTTASTAAPMEDILEDRFISFDDEGSSDDEFFTPNTSMEEPQDDLDDNCQELDQKAITQVGLSSVSSNAQQDDGMEDSVRF